MSEWGGGLGPLCVAGLYGGAAAGLLAALLPALAGRPLGEAGLLRAARAGQALAGAATLVLAALWASAARGAPPGESAALEWALPAFSGGHPALELGARIDATALALSAGTSALCALVQHFSARYLHREPGFARFFALLSLLQLGMQLLVTAAGFTSFIAGWELVGIASALLIAFFHERREPVENGLWAFGTYRVCDLGLLLGAGLAAHAAGSARFAALPALAAAPGEHGAALTAAGLLFALAAAGKSAQLPASAWLPRAMEGPTPSSAIFYGALSIHAGILLLLRVEPLLRAAPLAQAAVVVMGLATALYAALAGRVEADVKSRLAHAAMAQAGLILAELGLGQQRLALWHLGTHACWRTWQFLRAPSAIHDTHQRQRFARPRARSASGPFAGLRRSWRGDLYAGALDRFGLDARVERALLRPVRAVADALARLDPWAPPTAPSAAAPAQRAAAAAASAAGAERAAAAGAAAEAPAGRRSRGGRRA